MSIHDLPERCEERRIVCAANMCMDTGEIILGLRHWDGFMRKQADNLPDAFKPGREIQGFVDNTGTFMSREEAFILAERNGQMLTRPFSKNLKELFSENLY